MISIYTVFFLLILLLLVWVLSLLLCGVICRMYKYKAQHSIVRDSVEGKNTIQKKEKYGAKRAFHIFVNNLLYGYVRYITYRIGKIPSFTVRNILVRRVLCADISKRTILYENFELRSPWNLHVGASTIGPGCMLDSRRELVIEDGVDLSSGVFIWTEQHDINDPYFLTGNAGGPVIIRNHAWICSRATVLPKVTVGEGAIIAAGCVVSRDCNPYYVYGGVPNKIIGERNRPMKYELTGHWHIW